MTSPAAVLPSPLPLRARVGALARRVSLFRLGVALIALHVIDDSFLQPQPGTSAGDHLVSGLVPLALLGLAAWAYPRLLGGRQGALALALGALGCAAGIEAVYYAGELGASGDDYTGLLSIPAGLFLLGLGVVTLWRTRRRDGSRPRRYLRRSLLGLAGVATFVFVVLPIGWSTSTSTRPARSSRPRTWAPPTRT